MHKTSERPDGKEKEASNNVCFENPRDIRHERNIRMEIEQ